MERMTPTGKVIKNAGIGIVFNFLTIALAFVNRTIFIKVLGAQYLGVSGLYSNILSVLSLADLGFNSVLMFFLYEPLVKKDEARLSTLIAYFRRIYHLVAGVVFFIGIGLIPFLPMLVKGGNLSNKELLQYYLLFLVNTSCSYLAVYKSTMLIADQSAYVVNTVKFGVAVAQSVSQIVILYFVHSYTLYLIAVISCTIGNNIFLTYITDKRYRFLRRIKPDQDVGDLKTKILVNIKNAFLYRVGGTIMNSTDNILISVIVSTTAVGYYSNYVLITANIILLINLFSQAMMTAMGNFAVQAKPEKKELVFRSTMLIYAAIAAFVGGCIVCMMNDFMMFWLRDPQYVLGQRFTYILAFKLYVDVVTSPNWMFREASGLFREARNIMLWAAIVNILLSIILGQCFGMAGIIFATSISKICTLFWYEPKVFYGKIFHKPISQYWKYHILLTAVALISIAVSCVINNHFGSGVSEMIIKVLVCGLITLLSFFVLTRKSKEYQYLITRFHKKRAINT